MHEVDDFDFEDYFLEVEDEDEVEGLTVPEMADAVEEDGQFDRLW